MEWSYHLGTVATLAAEYKKKRGEKAKQVWLDEHKRFWDERMKVRLNIAKSLGVCYIGLKVFLIARSCLP
jgi:GH15 family glucan-1,4-alpha-glucosidase